MRIRQQQNSLTTLARSRGIAAMMAVVALAACDQPTQPSALQPSPQSASKVDAGPAVVTVFASGFNNPRGLRFGPDGYLYVAEGGTGGSNSTIGQCDQVPAVGPYTGSTTGSRISKISPTGVVSTVIDGLPSSSTNMQSGQLTSGVADVEFIGHTLYGLLTGAGCSHGVPSIHNQVFRVTRNGGWRTVADLSRYYKHHPTLHPEAGRLRAGRNAVQHDRRSRRPLCRGAEPRVARPRLTRRSYRARRGHLGKVRPHCADVRVVSRRLLRRQPRHLSSGAGK